MQTIILVAAALIVGVLACGVWLASDPRQSVEHRKRLYRTVYR